LGQNFVCQQLVFSCSKILILILSAFIGVHRRQMSFNDLWCAEYVYLRLSAFICG